MLENVNISLTFLACPGGVDRTITPINITLQPGNPFVILAEYSARCVVDALSATNCQCRQQIPTTTTMSSELVCGPLPTCPSNRIPLNAAGSGTFDYHCANQSCLPWACGSGC